MVQKLGLVFAFLIFALPLSAKDIYLTANGNGTGIGCSNAHSPAWFNNTANWGTGTTQIGPGTTVHLCGTFVGSPGQQLLIVRGNGTSTSPITIKFESGANLTAPYWSASGAIYMSGWSYIFVDGGTNGVIQNTASGTGRAYYQNTRAIYARNCTGCVVKNLTIANMYVRTSVSDLNPSQSQINCIDFVGANSFTINHVLCHDAGWGFAGNGNNFTLTNCNIYNVDHGLAFGAQGRTLGVTIHDNHIHGYANWDSPTNAYHHDGLHLWGRSAGGAVMNGTIYNNLFDGDSGVNITAHIYLQDSIQNFAVYNNVFLVPSNRTLVVLWFAASPTTYLYGGPATGNSAYNNFISGGGHTRGSALYIDAQYNFTAVNNILMGGQSDISLQDGSTLSSTGIDHNIYLELSDYSDWNTFGYNRLVRQTLAQWQSLCHCDTHSKLAHLSQINVSSLGQLLSGSVAISAATNLMHISTGTLAPLATDKIGALREVSGNWDAGAYKFGSVPQPAAPTGLAASVQ